MARGDHIFVYCLGYSHHGVDCGDGDVIHFDSDPIRKVIHNPHVLRRLCGLRSKNLPRDERCWYGTIR